jgi:PAS domain S-box-containing protein
VTGVESTRRLALLAEHANDILLMFDASGRIVEANARALAAYGYSREELLRLDAPALRAEGHRASAPGQLARAGGAPFTFETVHRRKDGSEFPVEVSTGPLEVDGGRYVLSVVRDVSSRKAVEAALKESEAKFREAFHGASVAIVLVSPQGNFLEWNEAFERLLGFSSDELATMRFPELLHPDDRAGSLAAFGAIVRGERDHNDMERRYVRKDGGVLTLRYRVGALRDEAGRLRQAIGIIEDVTDRLRADEERRRLQAKLALNDRMASLGTLAAGVAHEIANPLTYVVANVEMAREWIAALAASHADDPALAARLSDAAQALSEAEDGTRRVRGIVADLKVISAGGDEESADRVDLRGVLASSANLARKLVATRARFAVDAAEVPPVSGNAARLGQVVLNLIVNAAQAIPEGHPERHLVRASCGVAADGRVLVEVQDDGVGIAADRVGRIFEPFYTTKPSGVGTGLGLAICQTIVAAHGGEIRVESAEGKGSTFRVLLPAAAPTAPAEARAAPAPERRSRVLVVDDEPFVLRTLERILSPVHEVAVAGSAPEALGRIDAGVEFDAILCDVMMPVMSGIQFQAELARRRPALADRIAFVTGGAFTDDVRAFLEATHAPVVEKPFTSAQILDAVRRLAGRGR